MRAADGQTDPYPARHRDELGAVGGQKERHRSAAPIGGQVDLADQSGVGPAERSDLQPGPSPAADASMLGLDRVSSTVLPVLFLRHSPFCGDASFSAANVSSLTCMSARQSALLHCAEPEHSLFA